MSITTPKLPSDFADFLRLLEKYKVRYIVVGAWAAALHGRPRYTKDIDILIARESSNSAKMIKVLEEFGFGSVDLSQDDFLREQYVIQLGYEPNRIDILTDIAGVTFEHAEKRREIYKIEGISVPILSISDLISAKQASARPQDLADIDQLKRIFKLKNETKR